jgi:hypothetical protein
MAIKGKGRSKTRQVTRAPRQGFTPPPVPWFSRRWVQLTAALLAGILISAVFAWVRGNLRAASRDREERQQQAEMRTVMQRYQAGMEPILSQVGTPQPPVFLAFPRLGETIDAFSKGDASIREATETASATEKTASDAGDAMAKVDASTLLQQHQDLPATFTREVATSKSALSHAVTMYEESAALLGLAADATGDEQADLLSSAKELQTSADTLFADGYRNYFDAQVDAGTYQPSQPASGLPGGTGLPGGLPGGASVPQPSG